jgi:hypothetical protein
MKNDIIYAVRDEDTGKLVSNITSPRKKYWDRRGSALTACAKALSRKWETRRLKVVAFKLVEVEE